MPPSPDSSCAVALFDVMSMTHDQCCYVDMQPTSNTERNLCGSPRCLDWSVPVRVKVTKLRERGPVAFLASTNSMSVTLKPGKSLCRITFCIYMDALSHWVRKTMLTEGLDKVCAITA